MHVPRVVRSAVLLCFVLRAASVLAASEKPLDPLVQASNRFGAKLLAEIHRQNPQENVFISPASIAIALGVAWSGARGETRQEMARCLEIADLGIDSVDASVASPWTSFVSPRILRSIHRTDPGIELEIATSLWVAPGFTLRPEFIARTAKMYEAQVMQLEPSDTAERINAWVREKTHGKIDAIVERRALGPVILDILNAVYFRGAWEEEFDAKATQERPFHLPGGGVEHLPMMSRAGAYPYLEKPGFRAAALPYRDDMIRLYVALPDSTSSLSGLVGSLTGEAGWDWVQQLESSSGEVVLPRFTLANDLDLITVLERMGIKRAFGPGADFSGITEAGPGTMSITKVRHKAWIQINEKGTEAAGTTHVEFALGVTTQRRNPFRLVVDRPFLCIVRDRLTGLVLFLGLVTHPQRL